MTGNKLKQEIFHSFAFTANKPKQSCLCKNKQAKREDLAAAGRLVRKMFGGSDFCMSAVF